MKRISCFLLTFSFLLFFLASPVQAAQNEIAVYEFYQLPDISFYGDPFDFILDSSFDDPIFTCDYLVPDGVYALWLDLDGTDFYVGDISVVYQYDSDHSFYYYETIADTSLVVDEEFILGSLVFALIYYDFDMNSVFGSCQFYVSGKPFFSFDSFRLVPVSSSIDQLELDGFLSVLSTSFVDLGVSSLAIILLAPLMICSVLVLCWFGYRFIKRKVITAVAKGKL